MLDEVWLNRLGIVLNVLAWILLSPELIGAERLRRFESWLERNLHGATGIVATFRRGLRANWLGLIGCGISIAFIVAIVAWVVFGSVPREVIETGANFPLVGIALGVGLLVILWLLSHIAQFIVGRLARSLAGGDRLTSYMVGFGIVFFIVGNGLQLWATFLGPNGS